MTSPEKQPVFTLIDKSVKANSIGFTLISKLVKANPLGFTLIELLVVTAILGILVGISSTVFVGILRSQNKTNATNEVRQNANLVIDLFERDIRSASAIVEVPPLVPLVQTPEVYYNEIEVTLQDGVIVHWICKDESPGVNGGIRRDTDTSDSNPLQVTNFDPKSGVNIDCLDSSGNGAFQLTGATGGNQLVTLEFTAKQGVSAPARNDYQIELKFQTTLGTRNRN